MASLSALFLSSFAQVQTYIGTKAVDRSDLVDVIGMNMVIGAAGNGLAFAPTHGPAVHHTAGLRAGLVPLLARERVAVIRHNPGEAAGRSKGRVSVVRALPAGGFPKAPATCPLPCPHPTAAHPRRRRNHQAPSRRPPRQPFWLCLSQDNRFWGDRTGVMCPREWIETRSDATAGKRRQKGHQRAQALAFPSHHASSYPWTYLLWRRPRSLHSCPGREAHGLGWATSQRPQRLWAASPLGPALSARQKSLGLPPASAWPASQGHVGLARPPGVQDVLQFVPSSFCGRIPATFMLTGVEDRSII